MSFCGHIEGVFCSNCAHMRTPEQPLYDNHPYHGFHKGCVYQHQLSEAQAKIKGLEADCKTWEETVAIWKDSAKILEGKLALTENALRPLIWEEDGYESIGCIECGRRKGGPHDEPCRVGRYLAALDADDAGGNDLSNKTQGELK